MIYILIWFVYIMPLGGLVFPIGVEDLWCVRVQRRGIRMLTPSLLHYRNGNWGLGEITGVGGGQFTQKFHCPKSVRDTIKTWSKSYEFISRFLRLCFKVGRKESSPPDLLRKTYRQMSVFGRIWHLSWQRQIFRWMYIQDTALFPHPITAPRKVIANRFLCSETVGHLWNISSLLQTLSATLKKMFKS